MPGRYFMLVAVSLVVHGSAFAEEPNIKEFLPQNCRFTLPGIDWKWLPQASPKMVFLVEDSQGFRITLAVNPVGKEAINERSAKAFESGYFGGQVVKRGGRLLTFQGVPAYQTEGNFAEKTFATRYFIANGNGYMLTVIGGPEPIEADPAFESMMNGFSFLGPVAAAVAEPAAPADGQWNALHVSALMGRIAGVCLVLALVFFVIRKLIGPKAKPKPLKAKRVRDDEPDDGE